MRQLVREGKDDPTEHGLRWEHGRQERGACESRPEGARRTEHKAFGRRWSGKASVLDLWVKPLQEAQTSVLSWRAARRLAQILSRAAREGGSVSPAESRPSSSGSLIA